MLNNINLLSLRRPLLVYVLFIINLQSEVCAVSSQFCHIWQSWSRKHRLTHLRNQLSIGDTLLINPTSNDCHFKQSFLWSKFFHTILNGKPQNFATLPPMSQQNFFILYYNLSTVSGHTHSYFKKLETFPTCFQTTPTSYDNDRHGQHHHTLLMVPLLSPQSSEQI